MCLTVLFFFVKKKAQLVSQLFLCILETVVCQYNTGHSWETNGGSTNFQYGHSLHEKPFAENPRQWRKWRTRNRHIVCIDSAGYLGGDG